MRFPCAYCMLICQSLLLFEFVEEAFQGVMRDFSVPHLRVLKKAKKFILEFATYPCLPIQLQKCASSLHWCSLGFILCLFVKWSIFPTVQINTLCNIRIFYLHTIINHTCHIIYILYKATRLLDCYYLTEIFTTTKTLFRIWEKKLEWKQARSISKESKQL